MKRLWFISIAVIMLAALVMPGIAVAGETELTAERTWNSKTYQEPGGKYRTEIKTDSMHYKENGAWKDIDTTITESIGEYDYQAVKGQWQLFINDDTTAKLVKGAHELILQINGIAYLDRETRDYVILQPRQEVTPVVEGHRITWPDIFHGVNLVYQYNPDGFKEFIEITQSARDWATAHPPSDYGLNNQTSYLTFYYEVDYSHSYPAETGTGDDIDWSQDNDLADLINFRSPVTQKIISALPASYAYHENTPYDTVKIHRRFYSENDKNWLLFGASVIDLNNMANGTIIYDPDTEFTPDADPEVASVDGYTKETTSADWATIRTAAGDDADSSNTLMLSGYSCTNVNNQYDRLYRAIILFDTSGLDDSAVISAATLSIYANTAGLNNTGASPTFGVYSSNPASDTNLIAADHATIGSTAFSDTHYTFAVWDSSAEYRDYAFNASGLSAIDKTGASKFSWLESVYDVGGAAAPWVNSQGCRGYAETADSGAGKEPLLTVTWSMPPVPSSTQTPRLTSSAIQEAASTPSSVVWPVLGIISFIAFWRKHPVLFQIAGGISIIGAFYVPDSIGRALGVLPFATGYIMLLYALLCIYLSTWFLLFPYRKQVKVSEDG